MAKTVLSLLQGFFGEKGMPEPSGVVGVTDTAVIQAKRIL